ncbi:mannose-6-phosphate isomerase [Lingula anatina]|uniref:Mannose-6-phosphate isomerase n=1 Tax=Lingula anatina TaxID=7574 RepID=A0A1S3HRC0_LINAN|nr:mannose-6-phosphate isomerase [Lingula anatina]|eukprot:XP_013388578.1 mannose-6-phosphate isomerase [Lingula anatina]
MSNPKVFPLKCPVQTYHWGKVGKDSEVAKLSLSGNSDFKLDDKTTYAELWMGTHHKGPCILNRPKMDNTTLAQWVAKNQDDLGSKVKDKFQGQLPYLFKVLSVNMSLSIQAHPNKSHAEQLHKDHPDRYPDPNHKPEIAIALTPFQGMCGFRPIEELVKFLKAIPELQSVIGLENAQGVISALSGKAQQAALKQAFTALMSCDPKIVETNLQALISKVQERVAAKEDVSDVEGELLLRLNQEFPGDVGCFCIYFLNIMNLQPGESMFLEANLPHAYLKGDCIECMACSDNVVRAGLTPKFKDVPTLCDMLIYEPKSAKENLFDSIKDSKDSNITHYQPNIPDFAVDKYELSQDIKEYTIPSMDSASIVLVIKGEAEGKNQTLGDEALQLQRGTVLFIAANQEVQLTLKGSDILMFRAYCGI